MDIDLDKVLGDDAGNTAQQSNQQTQQTNNQAQPQSSSSANLGQMVQGNMPSASNKPLGDNQKDDVKIDNQKQQQTGGVMSGGPEGAVVAEGDNSIEKQFDELNEVLDTNLTDEIERDVFSEAIGQGPVPEGHEVLKKTIETEQEAEKAANPQPAEGTPQTPQVGAVPPVSPSTNPQVVPQT